jgi:hypothetical protein
MSRSRVYFNLDDAEVESTQVAIGPGMSVGALGIDTDEARGSSSVRSLQGSSRPVARSSFCLYPDDADAMDEETGRL